MEQWASRSQTMLVEMPPLGSRHPQFPALELEEIEPDFGRVGLGRFTLVYRGGQQVLGPPVYSIDVSAGAEDIRTHPDFSSLETAAENAGGYVEDEDGVFRAFTAPAQLAGVDQFLLPALTISKRWSSTVIPGGANKVGKIDMPDGPFPSQVLSGSQNFLKIGFAVDRHGDVYEVWEQWLRSGDQGWSTLIYGD